MCTYLPCLQPRSPDVRLMMESVRDWNKQQEDPCRIKVSLELEKPRHPLEYAELCDLFFISQVYAEEELKANCMVSAVIRAREMIENKK